MKAVDATRILLTRKHTTAKLRKQCARARETVMRSETPIYKEVDTDEFGNKQVEYFSSKPAEATPEQRHALKLRRATLVQLDKWYRRNKACRDACLGIVNRIPENAASSALRRRALFASLADKHHAFCVACAVEIARRNTKAVSRGN